MNDILKKAFLHAFGTVAYVVLLVTCMFYAPNNDAPVTVLVPISMLLLFVFSAALTGSLVLGQPILWYIDGRKKEAVSLFIYTLLMLFVFLSVAFFSLSLILYLSGM